MKQDKDNPNWIVTFKFFLIVMLPPLFLGGMGYILFRPESLLMFQWFDFLGLTSLIKTMRDSFGFLVYYIPEWIIYSFPDGVWVFSLTVFMVKIWQDGPIVSRLIWCSIGPVIGVGGEIAQYFSIIEGTFDIDDLVINMIFSALAFYLVNISHRGDLKNEN